MKWMADRSPEKGLSSLGSTETHPETRVAQPIQLSPMLGEFLEEIGKIGESAKGEPGEQWSGDGSGAAATQQTRGSGTSARDLAIANLPPQQQMQAQLEAHIREEIKHLRKQAKHIAKLSRPGAAYHINQLYARMRHLNALLAELLEASFEALKRLFIRVFVDKQNIV